MSQRRSQNKAIIAGAGTGKTQNLVTQALNYSGPVLLTTYTNENLNNIKTHIKALNGGFIPPNIEIKTWFTFLLQEWIKPYQKLFDTNLRVKNLYLPPNNEEQKLKKIVRVKKNKHDLGRYVSSNYVYNFSASDFVVQIHEYDPKRRMITRLEKAYGAIFLDEMQDLRGYDLDIIDILFNSNIDMHLVGDPRQAIYGTHNPLTAKNKSESGPKIYKWLKKRSDLTVEESSESYRCSPEICSFSERFFKDEGFSLTSKRDGESRREHEGVFAITKNKIEEYLEKFDPQILRPNKKVKIPQALENHAINIGISKGDTFSRVLIFPYNKSIKYFCNNNLEKLSEKTKMELYVAVTRARYSATFVIPQNKIDSIPNDLITRYFVK